MADEIPPPPPGFTMMPPPPPPGFTLMPPEQAAAPQPAAPAAVTPPAAAPQPTAQPALAGSMAGGGQWRGMPVKPPAAPGRTSWGDVSDSVAEAVTGAGAFAEAQQRAPTLAKGGAPLSERLYSSFLNTPKAKDAYLARKYGPEGEGYYRLADRFGNPTEQRVVRRDGEERLFNPPGIDWGDVASLGGSVPDTVGAVGGAAVSIPAYAASPAVGIPATAATSALGAQMVGETVGRMFPENRQAEPSVVSDVLPRAGGEALMDTGVGMALGGLGRAGLGAFNAVRAPFARSSADPTATAFREAVERLRSQGYDLNALPSEAGAGGFIPRMEGFLEKLPGSAERIKQYRGGFDRELGRVQNDLTAGADPVASGRAAGMVLEGQRNSLLAERNNALGEADTLIGRNQETLTGRQGLDLGSERTGQWARGGLERARTNFRDEAGRLYDAARAAPGGADPIVATDPIRDVVAQIRQALPQRADQEVMQPTGVLDNAGNPITRPEVIPGGPSPQFTPQGLTRLLAGTDEIEQNMTLDRARQMRTMVSDAIDDRSILPDVSVRYLTQLRNGITQAIEGGTARVEDPALREALGAANTFYRENVDQFSRKGVKEAYREPTQAGYKEDNDIVAQLISGRGKPGVIRDMQQTMGPNTPEWAAVQRNAMERILDTGRNRLLYGRQVVDADALSGKLNSMDDETLTQLFGVGDAQQLRNLAADVSNRARYLDADAFSGQGSPNIMQSLRNAASAERAVDREYRNGPVAAFLRGEDGAASKLDPAELVPWLYKSAKPGEVRQVMGLLPQTMREEVERGVMADIIERGIVKGGGDMTQVRRMLTGESNPADNQTLTAALGASGDTGGRQQAERIGMLISPENRRTLQDLALINARRQERDSTTAAVGGLAAGAAITNILQSPGSAGKSAIVANLMARAITDPRVRSWLTSTRRTELSPGQIAQSQVVIPVEVLKLMKGAAGESEDLQAVEDWLRQGKTQIGKAGERLLRPPDGAASWEQHFGGRR